MFVHTTHQSVSFMSRSGNCFPGASVNWTVTSEGSQTVPWWWSLKEWCVCAVEGRAAPKEEGAVGRGADSFSGRQMLSL